ncbi:PAS domain-containing protein [Nitrincola sp. A-D6]|uniref:PAS domain-containing protein n=1 Tax=Nitrincola sp. A-D6 TaxID=1545442 RepID=UPI0009DE7415|nr:PAS domain-containing protein [Nitrincola sp. A-D6]
MTTVKPWALTFTTRISLIFGFLGLMALLAASLYSAKSSEAQLQSEISNTLEQRHRTIQSLIENRLGLLNAYLDVASFNRVFTTLLTDDPGFDSVTDDMILLFQDSDRGALLDLFFLLSPDGRLIFDAGMPLYSADKIITEMDSPILYTSEWKTVGSNNLSIIRSVPIFDPSTIQLRGYMVTGLAIGQNRYFIQQLLNMADLDEISIRDSQNNVLIRASRINQSNENDYLNSGEQHEAKAYSQSQPLIIAGEESSFSISLSLASERFTHRSEHFTRSFVLFAIGFVVLLIIAGWLLHISHNRAISRLLEFITATQRGIKGSIFQTTGIAEYNQVGDAMQSMVNDLNIAATVFESGEGILVTDHNRIILRVNQAFTRITGYLPDEVTGKSLDCVKIKDENTCFNLINETLEKHSVWQDEIWSQRKGGYGFLQWTSISAVINDYDGSIINYVVTLLDVTERKEAEIRIRSWRFMTS